MECKNCGTPQRTDFNYCPHCGAKVIRNRLTFKNLSHDITERYFDLDNTFLRTFIHLFTKPELVIDGYISGIRRKYLNPISYLGIALTLSGLLIFLMQKIFIIKMDMDVFNQGVNPEFYEKITPVIYDFSSLVFILLIPVFAFAGWLTFNRQGYVFSEYLVVFLYTLAQWSIVSFPISLFVLIFAPQEYMTLSAIMLPLMVVYSIYALQRINKFSAGQLILRTFLFVALGIIGYFGIVIVFYGILFATGTITLEDLKPIKN
ncbi:MAG: DUF3667 domain-containing protein [Eudoraea sp.]|uniref:DUF3667 domain-containing protein n=1 Tax=Eudoraea sp. TaxID=1979955 RepID=UPI003C74A777